MKKLMYMFLWSFMLQLSLLAPVNKPHDIVYIFGYGSLVNDYSRQKTVDSFDIVPVILNGYRRFWGYPAPKYTALAIEKEKNSKINGILFAIEKSQMNQLSAREKDYKIVRLDTKEITNFAPSQTDRKTSSETPRKNQPTSPDKTNKNPLGLEYPNAPIFTYVFAYQTEFLPSQKRPVVLSYLYIVLEGFKNVTEGFADYFTSTTETIDAKNVKNDFKYPVLKLAKKKFGEENTELVGRNIA